MFTVTTKARESQTKGDVKRLRREGFIPFVLYSKGKDVETGAVILTEIEAAMRGIHKGYLPTTVFALQGEKGAARDVVVREIQYKPTTYEILHIDFMELSPKTRVEIKVPVELTNTVDCVGVKLGGFLQSNMRHIKVRCLPKAIPSHFEIDVKEMNIGQNKRVKDIVVPSGVTCLEMADNVVVSIVKPRA